MWRGQTADASHRRVEVVQNFFTDYGGNFRRKSTIRVSFVDDGQAPRSADRAQDGIVVQGRHRPRVNHFRRYAFRRSEFRRFRGAMGHRTHRNNRDVGSGAANRGLAQRNRVFLRRYGAFRAVKRLVLDE